MLYNGVMSRSAGFTVVEIMIFLAVTSMLLVVTTTAFSGVQEKNQFSTSVREIESFFQDTINDVSTGYFDALNGFTCSAGTSTQPSFAAGVKEQGSNIGCIYLGKVIHLNPGNNNRTTIEIAPVVGNRQISGVNVKIFTDAYPRTVYDTSLSIDLTNSYKMKGAVRLKTANRNAAGFYNTLAAASSGAQHVEMHLHNVGGTNSRADLDACVRSSASCASGDVTNSDWIVCFDDVNNPNRTALLTVKVYSLTTDLQFIPC